MVSKSTALLIGLGILLFGASIASRAGLRGPSMVSSNIVEDPPIQETIAGLQSQVSDKLKSFGFIAGNQPAAPSNRVFNQAKQVQFLPKGVIFGSEGPIGFTDRASQNVRNIFGPQVEFNVNRRANTVDPVQVLFDIQKGLSGLQQNQSL